MNPVKGSSGVEVFHAVDNVSRIITVDAVDTIAPSHFPERADTPEERVSRDVRDTPITNRDAFLLMCRVVDHLKNSGKPPVRTIRGRIIRAYQRFDSPQETYQTCQKIVEALSKRWVRKQKTGRKTLQAFRALRRKIRRVQHKEKVLVYQKAAAPILRAALPALHGQGFLRKAIRVHPYRPMDTFLGRHPVKVFRQGSRFDVIDAYCNIPILAGITKRALKQIVEW